MPALLLKELFHVGIMHVIITVPQTFRSKATFCFFLKSLLMSWEKVQGHHPLVEGQERHCKPIALCKRPSKYNPWLFITFSDRKGLHKITIIYKPPPVIFLKTLQLWAHPLQEYDSCQLKWFSLTYHFIDYSKCLYIYK